MHKTLIAAVAAGLLSCSHVQETDDPQAHQNEPGARDGTSSTNRNEPTREQRGRRPTTERPTQRPVAIEKTPNPPDDDKVDENKADQAQVEPDNTRVNARDRDDQNLTPMDQGNSQTDIRITQQIRKAVVEADGLSMSAKNVKIITRDGLVTLRGVVKSASEKQRIDEMARGGAGVLKVDNQLEVDSPSGD